MEQDGPRALHQQSGLDYVKWSLEPCIGCAHILAPTEVDLVTSHVDPQAHWSNPHIRHRDLVSIYVCFELQRRTNLGTVVVCAVLFG